MYHLAQFFIAVCSILLCLQSIAQTQVNSASVSKRPSLPMSIPPPPNFSSLSNKSGKFQIISAEYYSSDAKPFLYKRLIKLNTTTGEAWVLVSQLGKNGEMRKWIPLESK